MFAGKRVLITGASRGLGSVAAVAFAREGARLMLSGRELPRLEALKDACAGAPEVALHAADLLDPAAIAGLVADGEHRFGGFDIVLHALGGGYGMRDPLLTWPQLTTLHHVNLGAGAELNRLVAPGMIERGAGALIHVGSIASGEAVGSVGYNTIKAGLAAYVRSLGRELAGKGIVVTAILPGAFTGPDNAFERLARRNPEAWAEFRDHKLPRKRIGDAEELIPLIFLLAGPGGSMMSGSCVPIDAGEGFGYVHL